MTNIFYSSDLTSSGNASLTEVYAQVIDIILNEEHDDYDESGFNVGLIRYKPISIGGVSGQKINAYYALPKEISLQEYPLIGEIVVIERIFNRNFYSRRVNVNKLVNDINTFPQLNENIKLKSPSNTQVEQAKDGVMVPVDESEAPELEIPGDYFTPRSEVHPLKHFDGDFILQGRFGTSIRMSSGRIEDALNGINNSSVNATSKLQTKTILGPSKRSNSPIFIFTAGQYQYPTITTDSPAGLVMEDINRDDTVFVMSTDQNINFFHSTTGNVAHYTGYVKEKRDFIPPTITSDLGRLTVLGGSQLILNSSRVVINSKLSDIILSANLNTHMMANVDVSIDAGREVLITSKKISLLSSDIDGEPNYDHAVLADELILVLNQLIMAFISGTIGTGTGVIIASGDLITRLGEIQKILPKIKSSFVRLEK